MKKIHVMILAVSIALCITGHVYADAQASKKPQATCPVMGEHIDKKVYTDHKGKRIYFCCPGCINVFKKEPEKYIKILNNLGETIEDIPAEKKQDKPT